MLTTLLIIKIYRSLSYFNKLSINFGFAKSEHKQKTVISKPIFHSSTVNSSPSRYSIKNETTTRYLHQKQTITIKNNNHGFTNFRMQWNI